KHQDYKDKGSSEATTNDGGIPVTIAVVSTEQAGSLDYKLAILPVEIKACNGSKIIETYAFLDPGSSATFCTEKLMEDLQVFTQASIPVGKENTEKVPQDHLPGTVGTSLNQELLQGTDLSNSLIGVLRFLRFHEEPVAIMANIEGMFH
ncbi:diacylglycerol O-acyltransferase 1-like, partial [Tachysurus ichikawai]